MTSLYLRIYLAGYHGWIMPRWLRPMIAGTEWHRAWLCCHLGFFAEDGIAYSPAHPYPAPGLFSFCDEGN